MSASDHGLLKGTLMMKWVFKLYVKGETADSTRAVTNLLRISKEFLNDRCELEIIDILKTPEAAADAHIVAIPTLVKTIPPPPCKLIGDLSDIETVLLTLGLPTSGPASGEKGKESHRD